MMHKAKLGDKTGQFVREVRPSPDPAFVIASDRQLDDLVRFSTPASNFSILTVDPTFFLGEFDVTFTAYHHMLLESHRYRTHPVFIGPALIHYRKTFGTYVFFTSSLIGQRPKLQSVKAFGTDGEKALGDAFAHEFQHATQLTCFIHFRRNIKQQLQERHYPEAETKEVLDDVFGCSRDDVFFEGLVDSRNESVFEEKLAKFKEHVNNI